MNNYKISILFLLNKVKINKRGLCPVRCRITYRKKRKIFSSGLFINPEHWSSSQQEVKPPNAENNIINTQISLISQKINEAFLMLQVLPNDFNVGDIYKKFKGEDTKDEITILGACDLHNEKMKKLVGIDLNELSWSRYVESRGKVAEFIKSKYKKSDVKLEQLDLKFIKGLEYYWKTERKLRQATIYRNMQRVKKMIQFAIDENYLQKNPFSLYKNKKYKGVIVYLTDVELKKLMNYNFAQIRLQQIKDMFIFCCCTGLAYQEMASLRARHIAIGFDGNLWINMVREKTNQPIVIPLLPQAEVILEKYKEEGSDVVLPSISNQKFNSYLKEISSIVGIEKKLTHHIARKTFATTVPLLNEVLMEVVSELLGHSKITVTQEHYAKVVKNKVSEEVRKLTSKLGR